MSVIPETCLYCGSPHIQRVNAYNCGTSSLEEHDIMCRSKLCYIRQVVQLQNRVAELDAILTIIRNVHAQHDDDLCWMPADVNKIFVAAGLPPQDLHVGDKDAMRRNCERHVDALCSGGKWRSYSELESALHAAAAHPDYTYINYVPGLELVGWERNHERVVHDKQIACWRCRIEDLY